MQTEDEPVVNKPLEPTTKKSVQPVAEKSTEAEQQKPIRSNLQKTTELVTQFEIVQTSEKQSTQPSETESSASSDSDRSTFSTSTSSSTSMIIPLDAMKSKKSANPPLISQSVEPTSGQDCSLGPCNVQSTRAEPPSVSETPVSQSVTMTDIMETLNQLCQTVNKNILKTDTEIASLRSKMKANIAVVQNDLNANKSEVAAVRSLLVILLEIVTKGKQ